MRSSKSQVERAANAIKFLVPLNGHDPNATGLQGNWTAHGVAVMKWPKNFTANERKLLRKIVRTVIDVY
jgi:hypothetical protein